MLHDSEKDFIKRHIGTSEEEWTRWTKTRNLWIFK